MAEEENTPTTPEPQTTPAPSTATRTRPRGPGQAAQDIVITDAGPCKKHIKVTVTAMILTPDREEK